MTYELVEQLHVDEDTHVMKYHTLPVHIVTAITQTYIYNTDSD